MTTNQILTASLLDILFENRNKEYGAYIIRKEYPKNLMKALGLMVFIASCFAFLAFKENQKNAVCISPVAKDSLSVTIRVINLEQPKPQEPQRFVTEQPPTRLDRVPVIVDKPDPDKNVPDRTDTTSIALGSTISPGSGGDPNIILGIISDKIVIAQNPVEPTPSPLEPTILDFSQIPPEFPGGTEAWINYLQRMLRVPDDLEAGDRKTVLVKFVVNADGDVTDAIVIKSGGNAFDKEVLRVISRMPKWKPGKQNGKAVAVYFTQPVTFAASEE